MINVTEVRITNWVELCIFGGKGIPELIRMPVRIHTLSWDQKYIKIQDGITCELRDLRPIKLTPYLFEQMGFIRNGTDNVFYSYRKQINSADELAWYSQDGELRYQTMGSGFTRNFSLICTSVHQLQKLYYALTGQELVFDLRTVDKQ